MLNQHFVLRHHALFYEDQNILFRIVVYGRTLKILFKDYLLILSG